MRNIIIITDEELEAYPGVVIRTQGTRELILRLTNDIVSDITGPLDPVPGRVTAIALEVARRATTNPSGATSVSRKIDDYTETDRWENGSNTEGLTGVYLTDDEKKELRGLVETGSSTRPKVRSVRMKVMGTCSPT